MADRDVLPGGPPGRGPGPQASRGLLLAAVGVAVLLVVALVWFLTNREAEPPVGSAGGTTEPSASAGATRSPGSSASPSPRNGKSSARGTGSSTAASTATASPKLAPNASFRNTCRYVLGDSTTDPKTGFRFLAESVVKNTGNTGIEVEVQAIWEQGEAESVTEIKRAQVDWRKGTTLKFSVPATRQQIDVFRSHTGPDTNCKVNASIISTYGTLH